MNGRKPEHNNIMLSSSLGNSANTDLNRQAKGLPPAPSPTLETNKQSKKKTAFLKGISFHFQPFVFR